MDESTARDRYGWAELTPTDDVVAATYTTLTITYTVGSLGMDDGSTFKVATEVHSDWGPPQFADPTADNYASVHTSGEAAVEAAFNPRGYVRPWMNTVDVDVHDGTLDEGDTITLVLGDTSRGSRGIQAQSFAEAGFEFRPIVDVFETGTYKDIVGDLRLDVVGGPAVTLDAIAPSTAAVGEPIELTLRARDEWGNIARDCSTPVEFRDDDEALETPGRVSLTDGLARATVTCRSPGVYRPSVRTADGLEATANPIRCIETATEERTFWGDLHGQSEETVGTGSIRDYFAFAREAGALDFAAPANHDFQMDDGLWDEIRDATHAANDPGEFVAFLSYEWSANTPNGGDHNVYFRGDEPAVARVSNWAVEGKTEAEATAPSIEALYDHYAGRDDVLIIPHQGGRPASLEVFDAELTPFLELLSLWGVFEWFGNEALERGYPVGFVGGTDDTTGRLGATYPSTKAWYNTTGGLMGVCADDLTREALWEAFVARRVYATTGARILLDVTVDGVPMGARTATDGPSEIAAAIEGTAPLARIDLFRGADAITGRDLTRGDEWLEVVWTGLHSKHRRKHVDWSGGLRLNRGRITNVAAFGFDNPDQGLERSTERAVEWTGFTSGNDQGLRLRIDAPPDAVLSFESPQVSRSFRLDDLDRVRRVDAGPLNKRLTLRPTGEPDSPTADVAFTDEAAPPGSHPYYVRVRQVDGERAWSSPAFVERSG